MAEVPAVVVVEKEREGGGGWLCRIVRGGRGWDGDDN